MEVHYDEFPTWLYAYVNNPQNKVEDVRIKYLAQGPKPLVHYWSQYYTNGYRFHTLEHSLNKKTMNSGVCVKGSSYNSDESDYYGLLTDVIQLEYFCPGMIPTTIVLFKCKWFDPTPELGYRVITRHGLVEVNMTRKLNQYEPFVLAAQAHQVYFAGYAASKKERRDWCVVYKIRARHMIDSPDLPDQDDEESITTPPPIDDDFVHLRDNDNEEEIVVENDRSGTDDNFVVDDNYESDVHESTDENDDDIVESMSDTDCM